MVTARINADDFLKWFGRLVLKVERNISFANRKSSRRLAAGYRDRMSKGLDARGVPMAAVKEVTMDMPIRASSDRRKRSAVNPSQGKSVVATGATAKSIKEKRVNRNEYIIESTTARGNTILSNNAGPSRKAGFGKKRRQKVKRDPMQVTEKQIAIVEKEILAQLDKAFK